MESTINSLLQNSYTTNRYSWGSYRVSILLTQLANIFSFIAGVNRSLNIGNISNTFFTLIPTVDVKTFARVKNLLLRAHLMYLSE
jgi:hypothetical protein